jgi:hypothetical protein
MELITWVLIGISVLFFVLLGLKNIFKAKKLCVICASVALTWIVLFVLSLTDFFSEKTIMAILMGMTALGIYYLLEKKVKKGLTIFRLPFLLTLIFIIYIILESFSFNGLIFLAVLWVIFILIYLFRNNKGFNRFTNKLIGCCKKW